MIGYPDFVLPSPQRNHFQKRRALLPYIGGPGLASFPRITHLTGRFTRLDFSADTFLYPGALPWLILAIKQTAQGIIEIGQRLITVNFTVDLAPSALYLLASPSTPEPARTEALELAESGEKITHQAAKGIIEIGQRLIEVKERLGHGEFLPWLKSEFDWSLQSAKRFMNVAETFGQNQQIVDFYPSALYLLAAPSVPEEARQEALELAESGEKISHQAAKGIIEIGQRLIEVKERLGHGNWLPWLESEFGWSHTIASNFMNVAQNFPQIANNLQFQMRALYLLASPSTPESARTEALELAESGEKITHQAESYRLDTTQASGSILNRNYRELLP